MRKATVLVLFCAALVNAGPGNFACTRSMAVGEVKPMDAPNTIVEANDRQIDTVGGVACGGTLQTGMQYAVAYTLPASGYQFLIEAKGVGATFSSPFTGCADRQSGNSASDASTVTFTSAGNATFRMLSSLGSSMDNTTAAAPECRFTIEQATTTAAATTTPTPGSDTTPAATTPAPGSDTTPAATTPAPGSESGSSILAPSAMLVGMTVLLACVF